MWNAAHKPIPRNHRTDVAIGELEIAQTAILEADTAPDIEAALGEIEELYPWLQWCCSKIRHEMQRRDYDPYLRFEAVGNAIKTLKRQIGRA